MQDLIVLGLVPGTDFQITFTMWIYGIMSLFSLSWLRYAWQHRRQLELQLAALHIAFVIDRGQVLA